ncbi:hypothetical protein ABTW96_01420 [Nocardia beijingensis]|uniref:hypothetical protein n=1 Tax=Nocardia beijingensis TaxID=95162 RepID=UPI0033165204
MRAGGAEHPLDGGVPQVLGQPHHVQRTVEPDVDAGDRRLLDLADGIEAFGRCDEQFRASSPAAIPRHPRDDRRPSGRISPIGSPVTMFANERESPFTFSYRQ